MSKVCTLEVNPREPELMGESTSGDSMTQENVREGPRWAFLPKTENGAEEGKYKAKMSIRVPM